MRGLFTYVYKVPADLWCHKKCTVHRETKHYKHCGLSAHGSIEGHLFLVQMIQIWARPETQMRKGLNKDIDPDKCWVSLAVSTSSSFYCLSSGGHLFKIRHHSHIEGSWWQTWWLNDDYIWPSKSLRIFQGELLASRTISTLLVCWKLQAFQTERFVSQWRSAMNELCASLLLCPNIFPGAWKC